MTTYSTTVESITADQLNGFFEGWPQKPSREKHLSILRSSSCCVLAYDDHKLVGFITAITDEVLAAYIPLLEVLPEYRGQGIGSELVRQMLKQLDGYYMIDLVCDDSNRKFYEKLGMKAVTGMILRNPDAI